MTEEYDSSWDLEKTEDGNLPDDEDAFDRNKNPKSRGIKPQEI